MTTRTKTLGQYFRGLTARSIETEQTDRDLLDRYLATRDGAAFAALVHRHGPMVFGVCRRVLGDPVAAEDAFQATFLLLSKKAHALRKQEALPSWLHGVARRTALKARTSARRRSARERRVPVVASLDPIDNVTLREALAILDEELAQLPEKYRAPLVLCCLEGQARDEAAQQLGWTVTLVKSRLEQARELLRRRLLQRGLTLSAGLFAVLLTSGTVDGGVPPSLVGLTIDAAGSGTITPAVAALVKGVHVTMTWQKTLRAMLVLFLCGAIAGAVTVYLQPAEGRVARPAHPAAASRLVQHVQAAQPVEQGRIYFHVGFAIHAMEPNGRDQKDVPRANPHDDHYYQPYSARFSPDGKWLAFGQSRVEGNAFNPPDKIRIRSAENSDRSEILVDMPGVELQHWVWSADGKQLAIASWDKENRRRSWIVDVQTKKVEQLALPTVKDEKEGDYQMFLCAWSPDGRHFLALGKGMHLVKRDGTQVRCLTELAVWDGECRFAPDGKKALFVTFNKNRSNSLYVVDLAGGKPTAIVESSNFMDMRAVWSPDGKRIAYVATQMDANGERGDETTLFLVDADGQNVTSVRSEKHDPREIRMVLTDWR